MDFIEQLFGISPDGGDGTTEMLFVLAFIAIIVGLVAWRIYRRRTR
jgi:hypothetical protein